MKSASFSCTTSIALWTYSFLKWLSPPSHCTGSIMNAAMSFLFFLNAVSISLMLLSSSFSTSSAESASRGKFILGLVSRGQSNFGKYFVLFGSYVLVMLMVYPLLPWNASFRWMIFEPFSPFTPSIIFFLTFQSNAALSAFSTASAPPSIKKKWFM